MSDEITIIEKGYSFNSIDDKAEWSDHQTATTYYTNNLPDAANLIKNIPIFLDTNVLLSNKNL